MPDSLFAKALEYPMLKTILVPIDVSQIEAGGIALDLARDLAKIRGGKLVLLNVVERVPGYAAVHIPPRFHEKAKSDASAGLKDLASKHGLADTAEVVVRDGHPSLEILDFANKIGADAIVIASHDPGIADYLLGSVAARVVRHAHCSVFVARKLQT
jgi:nucleotide-binding universal stress UspA family protein